MRAVWLAFSLSALAACGPKVDTTPNVIFETDLGIIEIEVYPDKAPVSAADFLNYVDRGFYNGQGFYRTVRSDNDPREMGMSLIQGGRLDMEPLTEGIAHETTQDTSLSNIAGSIAIARDAPGTGSAAYIFINLGNNDFLDYGGARNADGQGYAVFGKVVSSLDVPRAIQAQEAKRPTEEEFLQGQFLTKPVIIKKAYRK